MSAICSVRNASFVVSQQKTVAGLNRVSICVVHERNNCLYSAWHEEIGFTDLKQSIDRMSMTTENMISKTGLSKIHSFWPHIAILWFLQAEAMFFLKGIHNEDTKYSYLVGALDENLANFCKPHTANSYATLKKRLLKMYNL